MLHTEATEKKFYEADGNGIPFYLIAELFAKLPYASHERTALRLLSQTGCRTTELNRLQRHKINEGYIYWKLGKNQTSYRREYLSDNLREELYAYWQKHGKPPNDRVLHISEITLRTYFSKRVRPLLSDEWRQKVIRYASGELGETYKYSLKGFRKNFATLLFYHYWKKYGDARLACSMVSKRMKHESEYLTVSSYISTAETIEVERFAGWLPFEIGDCAGQVLLCDYYI